jgi:Icc-related predicted phosphoesterase
MRILAFGDLHGNKSALRRLKIKSKGVDLVVCTGDITWFGKNMSLILKELNNFGKIVLLIHGNHEISSEIKREVSNFKFIKFIHKKIHRLDKYVFFGYGGGGFSKTDKTLERIMKKFKKNLKKGDKVIFVSHTPPSYTKCDIIQGYGYVGSDSVRNFIEVIKPLYNINGHIHETFSRRDKIGETIIINPGPEGKILRI